MKSNKYGSSLAARAFHPDRFTGFPWKFGHIHYQLCVCFYTHGSQTVPRFCEFGDDESLVPFRL